MPRCIGHSYYPNVLKLFFSLGFTLVAKQMECDGEKRDEGYVLKLEQCAKACQRGFQMFTYGTNDHGEPGCNKNGCRCICQIASYNFECISRIPNNGFHLYKYQGKIFHFC